jgi:hypothetical protein
VVGGLELAIGVLVFRREGRRGASSVSSAAVVTAAPSSASSSLPVATPTSPPAPPGAVASAEVGSAPLAEEARTHDGFRNPFNQANLQDPHGPAVFHQQGREVRLYTKVVKNESDVPDEVVRSAIDHTPWLYGECYRRVFQGAKDVTGGTVTVAFDIVDKLPVHARAVASSFANPGMAPCVAGTLTSHTMNAVGSGQGHVVYGFLFVLAD